MLNILIYACLEHKCVFKFDRIHGTIEFAVVCGDRGQEVDGSGGFSDLCEGRLYLRLHHLLLGQA